MIKRSGTPSFSAQWMCALFGVVAIMTSATKGRAETPRIFLKSFAVVDSPCRSTQAAQHPSSTSRNILRILLTCPDLKVEILGITVGFSSQKSIIKLGSPPALKNSRPSSSTSHWKLGCVAILTRALNRSLSSLPGFNMYCTSPRVPSAINSTSHWEGSILIYHRDYRLPFKVGRSVNRFLLIFLRSFCGKNYCLLILPDADGEFRIFKALSL